MTWLLICKNKKQYNEQDHDAVHDKISVVCSVIFFHPAIYKYMQWLYKNIPPKSEINTLSELLNVNETLASILLQRGIDTFEKAKDYFRPQLSDLHDPFLMKDMDKAINRLTEAISANEKIMIYGDYDVDGTTSVSTVFGFLRQYHTNMTYYIPDRYKEGYGVSQAGIEHAKEVGVSLIISLDCGIKAIDKIAYAKELGIDFIVCDHHRPGKELPAAVAVLDPKRDDCAYPYKELCGCGVGFKLLQAFCQQQSIPDEELFNFLDLVAIATASDIVPITGENRILTFFGLKKMNDNPRPGIKALIDVSGFKKNINITNIVFGIGPRINAAGRIEHAQRAVELLLCENLNAAEDFAKTINDSNDTRRDFDKSITAEALEMIAEKGLENTKTTVLYKEDWHKGVIGIVASRCIETYYRPTIIFTRSNGKATGSARSVKGFDVYEAISSCSDLLDQFGGHMYAAGLTLPVENIDAFKEKFEEVVSTNITKEMLTPQVDIDAELDLDLVSMKFLNILDQMEPFGPENLQPTFASLDVEIVGEPKLLKEEHLKMTVRKKGGKKTFDAIGFGMKQHYEAIKKASQVDICYHLDENTFMDKTSIQLRLKDVQCH